MTLITPPAGVSPAGFFVPNVYDLPKDQVVGFLADPIDMTTGEYLSIEEGFDPTDAQVITALRTVRASGSAVQNVGRDFSEVTHISPRHETILRQEIVLALQELIDLREIEIVSITVEEGEEEYGAWLRYRHTPTGQLRPLFVPLGKLIVAEQ